MSLDVGDVVTLLVRSVSHDEVDSGGVTPALPQATRRMDLSDAVVLPGHPIPADGAPSSSYHSSGAPVLDMKGGDVFRVGDSTAAKALALAEKVDARLTAIQAAYDAHTHVSVTSLGTPTVPVPLIGPLAATDCDDLKVRS